MEILHIGRILVKADRPSRPWQISTAASRATVLALSLNNVLLDVPTAAVSTKRVQRLAPLEDSTLWHARVLTHTNKHTAVRQGGTHQCSVCFAHFHSQWCGELFFSSGISAFFQRERATSEGPVCSETSAEETGHTPYVLPLAQHGSARAPPGPASSEHACQDDGPVCEGNFWKRLNT